MKHFYEKNKYILESEVNKTFEEILWMSDDEFRQWLKDMRNEIVYAWDHLGLPPRVGFDEQQIIDQFNKMSSFTDIAPRIRPPQPELGSQILITS